MTYDAIPIRAGTEAATTSTRIGAARLEPRRAQRLAARPKRHGTTKVTQVAPKDACGLNETIALSNPPTTRAPAAATRSRGTGARPLERVRIKASAAIDEKEKISASKMGRPSNAS